MKSEKSHAGRRVTGYFSGLDRSVTMAIRRVHGPGRTRFAHAVTFLGSHSFLIPAAILASGVLLIVGWRSSARFLGFSMLVGSALSPLLKRRFRRGRPDLWTPLATESTHSFPSGHATMGSIFFGAIGMVLWREIPGAAARTGTVLFCSAMVFLVALSRVYLGAHWLSDVLAGILLAAVWLTLSAFLIGF